MMVNLFRFKNIFLVLVWKDTVDVTSSYLTWAKQQFQSAWEMGNMILSFCELKFIACIVQYFQIVSNYDKKPV